MAQPPLNRVLVLVALLAATASCDGGSGSSTTPSSTTPSTAATDSELAACVTTTNQFRASVGLPPLERSSTIEAYAATAAQADDASGVPHSYSIAHNGGTSGGWAENETLRQGLDFEGGNVGAAIQFSLNFFWSEGPGGGHYQNIVGPYSQMGCGVFVNGAVITVVQDFRS